MSRRLIALLALALFAAPTRAAGPLDGWGEGGASGTIVQIAHGVAYFDLGTRDNLQRGATLTVLRTINTKHPVTGATLVDYFPMGTLVVEGVGHVLSYGRLEKALSATAKVGDVVWLRQPAATPQPEERESRAPAHPRQKESLGNGEEGAAADEVSHLFQLTLGKTLSERRSLLEQYLRVNPSSPYAAAISTEVAAFKREEERLAQAQADAAMNAEAGEAEPAGDEESPDTKDTRLEILGQFPTQRFEGDPLEIAISVRHPERVAGGAVYSRPLGTSFPYRSFSFRRDGDSYFRAAIPETEVKPPGLDIFVELVDVEGHPLLAGTQANPRQVTVTPLVHGPMNPGPGHSAVRGFFEFVDFNRFRGNDYYLQTEGDVTYRLGTWLWAVRTGFGVIYGRGANKSRLDGPDPAATGRTPQGICDPNHPKDPWCGDQVGFNYGYVETELRIGSYVGIIGRLLAGQTIQGPGMGGELKLRIGQELGTNLLLGGSILQNFGSLAQLQLEWNVVKGWPMSAAVLVTDQPVEQNIGVRIVYQVAYRARPWLQPALRIGYGARDISHAGLSVGLGLIMAW